MLSRPFTLLIITLSVTMFCAVSFALLDGAANAQLSVIPVGGEITGKDVACDSEKALGKLKNQADTQDVWMEWKNDGPTEVTVDLDSIVTLGQTYHGVVCGASLTGKRADETDEDVAVYYRVDSSNNMKHLYLEFLDRNVALGAR